MTYQKNDDGKRVGHDENDPFQLNSNSINSINSITTGAVPFSGILSLLQLGIFLFTRDLNIQRISPIDVPNECVKKKKKKRK